MQKKANEKFIEWNKRELISKSDMVELLNREKPESVPDGTWQAVQHSCRVQYFDELLRELRLSEDLRSVIEKNNLDLLDPDQQMRLRETAQQISQRKDYLAILRSLFSANAFPAEKPNTLSELEWSLIKDVASLIARAKGYTAMVDGLLNGVIPAEIPGTIARDEQYEFERLASLIARSKDYSAIVNGLLRDEVPAEMPGTLESWEWDKIKKLDALIAETRELETEREELSRQKDELATQRSELEKEQKNLLGIKEKALKQLDFINNVLTTLQPSKGLSLMMIHSLLEIG